MFPTVKEFSKSVNSWWSYRKKFDTMFFSETQCIYDYSPSQHGSITVMNRKNE